MRNSTQAATRNYYNLSALDYFYSTHQILIPNLWDKIDAHIYNSAILDIGCGSGRDLRYFSGKGYDVVGIDVSHNLIKLAHEYSDQPVALADMFYLPFEKAFNVAWAIASLLHINRRGIYKVLSEINRVLFRDSIFVASVKKGRGNALDNKGRYFTYYQTDEWAKILKKANFDVMLIEETTETRNKENVEWIVTVSKPNFSQR